MNHHNRGSYTRCLELFILIAILMVNILGVQAEVLQNSVFAVEMNPVIAKPEGNSVEFFVSTLGNDKWSGKLPEPNSTSTDGPFATLEKAKQAVRETRMSDSSKGFCVTVRGGTYHLTQTFKLDKNDSGKVNAPIIYRAKPGEKVIISGGKSVSGFTPYKGKILQTKLNDPIFRNVIRKLFFKSKKQILARWPDYDPAAPFTGGWASVDGKIVTFGEKIEGETEANHSFFTVKAGDVRSWNHVNDAEVFIFPRYNYWNNIVQVKSFDPSSRLMTLASACSYTIRPGDRYFIQGPLEELNMPGEWHFDHRSRTLYFYPPEAIGTESVEIPLVDTLVELSPETTDIQIQHLIFESCNKTGVHLSGTQRCLIAGCTLRNLGDSSSTAVGLDNGKDNTILGCDIHDVGSHGIRITGGDIKKLTATNNQAINNHIYRTGIDYKQGVGIWLEGVGNRVAHNHIHDTPRIGIMMIFNSACQNNIVEYNHIHHVNFETEDTGAIYASGRDWISSRGCVIRYNFIHDSLGMGREKDQWVIPHWAGGIYLDDLCSGVDVIGNVVARCPSFGLMIHSGRDNHVENNIFIDCKSEIAMSGWLPDHSFWTSHEDLRNKAYSLVAEEPLWKNLRGWGDPRNAPLPDSGMIMTNNHFSKNIFSSSIPHTVHLSASNLPLTHTKSDHNLVWLGKAGNLPLTGFVKSGKAISSNYVKNAGFEKGTLNWSPHSGKLPEGCTAAVVKDQTPEGKQVLLFTHNAKSTAANSDPPRSILLNDLFTIAPGKTYRIKAKMKSDKEKSHAALFLMTHVPDVYYWQNSPCDLEVGTTWKDYEFTFRLPAHGEDGYHDKMKQGQVRIDFIEATGKLWVDDVRINLVQLLSEWESWQAYGFDKASLIADPQFVEPDQDNFRLKPSSPAFSLGFKEISWDKMGCYQDESRATWPLENVTGWRPTPAKKTNR